MVRRCGDGAVGPALVTVGVYASIITVNYALQVAYVPALARRRWIRGLLHANGVVSVAGAVATAVTLRWVQTPVGIASFLAWNALLIAAMVLVGIEYAPPHASLEPARASQ